MVNISFAYSKEDYVKGVRTYLRKSKIVSRNDLIVLVLLFIFSVYYLFSSNFEILSIVIAIVFIVDLFLMLLVYVYKPIYTYNTIPKLKEEQTFTFENDSIHFKTKGVDSKIDWSFYKEVWKNEDFYFLVQKKYIYFIIPITAFSSNDDIEAFDSILLHNYKSIKQI